MREIDETAAGIPHAGADSGDEGVAAELARAAREAVRQSDPRIDRQLAKMGLGDDEGAADSVPARPIRATDLDEIRSDVDAARSEVASLAVEVAQLRGRVTLLGSLVAVEGVAVVVLAVLLLAR